MSEHMPTPSNVEVAPKSSHIERRLAALRQEYAAGEQQLRALEERERDLRSTMLRIQGAIAVLEECLEHEESPVG